MVSTAKAGALDPTGSGQDKNLIHIFFQQIWFFVVTGITVWQEEVQNIVENCNIPEWRYRESLSLAKKSKTLMYSSSKCNCLKIRSKSGSFSTNWFWYKKQN